MPTAPTTPQDAPGSEESPQLDLVVVHLMCALHTGTKGYRITVRIQDGWTGPTVSHWARGGSSVACAVGKVTADAETAIAEALELLSTF